MSARRVQRLCFLLGPILALAGCGGRPSAGAIDRPQVAVSTTTDARTARVEGALAAAADYLIAAQWPDGAWRSDVYGAFKSGDALTPLALMALLDLPNSPHKQTVIDKGTAYLANLIAADDSSLPRIALTYPAYTAAGALTVLARSKNSDRQAALNAWLRALHRQQLTEDLGWQADDSFYGGWGYAKDLPLKPSADQTLNPLAEPNLSATVFALEALRAAGADDTDPSIQTALRFVRRCQNFSDDPTKADDRFDDGGFFFIQNDRSRNKAGPSGTDANGRQHDASYGSATADGLRALILCGLPSDDPRVTAARRWLETHFSASTHPGDYRGDRVAARNAPYFYYCRSMAYALNAAGGLGRPLNQKRFQDALADELLDRLRSDGSWCNSSVDVREDDPLVATPLAMMALAACQAANGP